MFYDTYPAAARSFYAAHYAHFGAYETLLDHEAGGEETARVMDALHREVMAYVERPPKFEPPAEIIAPRWSKMAWETSQAMDWTHMLHSQLYDILTDDRVEGRHVPRTLSMHANGGHHFRGDGVGGDSWRVGVAVDYPVDLFSRLLMADVVAEVPVHGGRNRVWLELGTRWQSTNASVIDLGLATRLDEWEAGRSTVELTVGIARAFGISGLVGVPKYPEPTLD